MTPQSNIAPFLLALYHTVRCGSHSLHTRVRCVPVPAPTAEVCCQNDLYPVFCGASRYALRIVVHQMAVPTAVTSLVQAVYFRKRGVIPLPTVTNKPCGDLARSVSLGTEACHVAGTLLLRAVRSCIQGV